MNTAIVLFAALFLFFTLGVPIAFSLGMASAVALLTMGNTNLVILAQSFFQGMNSFPYLSLPFFILAGNLMASGGISKRLINFASAMFGNVTGGLAIVSVISCMFFAAVCGSAAATCAAVGAIMIPGMLEKGYDKDFSGATICCASASGIIIPPSVPMIIYCVTVGASVGDAFIAGVIPGVIFCAALAAAAYIRSKKRGYVGGRKYSAGEKLNAFREAILPLLMPVIILGGIYGGVFTATEAAVVAVVYGLVVSVFVFRELKFSDMKRIFRESAVMAGGLLLLIGAANLFGMVLTRERIPALITELFLQISTNKYLFLLIVNILFLLIGMVMESSPAIIIMAPLLAPVATYFGIDLIHFGVIMIVNLAIGMASPPFGLSLFVIVEIAKTRFINVVRNMAPYFAVLIGVLLLITYIDKFSLLLLG